jgi:hypothetical protein
MQIKFGLRSEHCPDDAARRHPLGATGVMLLSTVLDELERQDLRTALVTLWVGAGMGPPPSSNVFD